MEHRFRGSKTVIYMKSRARTPPLWTGASGAWFVNAAGTSLKSSSGPMIQEKRPLKHEYNHAFCDACEGRLTLDDPRDDIGYAHHAELVPKFGYGHPYDSMHSGGKAVICGTCWQKVLILLDLPAFVEAWGAQYMADGRIVRGPEAEEGELGLRRKGGDKEPLKTSWDPDPKKLD